MRVKQLHTQIYITCFCVSVIHVRTYHKCAHHHSTRRAKKQYEPKLKRSQKTVSLTRINAIADFKNRASHKPQQQQMRKAAASAAAMTTIENESHAQILKQTK